MINVWHLNTTVFWWMKTTTVNISLGTLSSFLSVLTPIAFHNWLPNAAGNDIKSNVNSPLAEYSHSKCLTEHILIWFIVGKLASISPANASQCACECYNTGWSTIPTSAEATTSCYDATAKGSETFLKSYADDKYVHCLLYNLILVWSFDTDRHKFMANLKK